MKGESLDLLQVIEIKLLRGSLVFIKQTNKQTNNL